MSIEAPLDLSNVAHIDPDSGKPTRVRIEFKDEKMSREASEKYWHKSHIKD